MVGPASAMAWVTAEFLALLLSGRSANAYRVARIVTSWLAAPIKYADRWLDAHPMAYTVASGVWARARRPAAVAAGSRAPDAASHAADRLPDRAHAGELEGEDVDRGVVGTPIARRRYGSVSTVFHPVLVVRDDR